MSDDDEDDGNVKPARTNGGGGHQRCPTIEGRVREGAALPPGGERKRMLSGPPLEASPEN